MNDRLKVIAEQAGYFIKFERTGNDVTMVHTNEPGTDGDPELFAELIVRECIELVEGYTKQRAYDTYYKAEEQIRAHFGVSE